MFAGLLNSIGDKLAAFASPLDNPQYDLNDPRTYDLLTGGQESDAGISVTPEIALTLAPVWQSVSIISGDVATATAHVYKRMSEGDREIDQDHEVDFLISDQPNEEMSAFELIRRFMIHLLLWQNGYLYLDRVGKVGRVNGIYNLLPDRTCAKRDENGKLYYVTEVGHEIVTLMKEQVIHVKGLSIESGIGCELAKAARNSWGLALAAEGFGARFFKNGAQAGGVVELPIGMGETAQKNVVAGIEKKYTGKDNWFKTMVLRDGAKFHAMTIDAQKSQLTELRESQVRDSSRFFNLPPGKLGLEDSVSYNSAEQTQIQYITGCLTHWFSAIRGEFQLKLLSEKQRRSRTHFIDFNVSKLIERDLKTQVDILAIERQNEIINAAEWRRKRDLPPRTDDAAMEYVNPNTKSNSGTAEPAEESTEENAMEESVRSLLRDAANRMARRVCASARKSSRSGIEFEQFVESRAAELHRLFDESMLPVAGVLAAFRGGDGTAICGEIHMRFFSSLFDYLNPVLDKDGNALESNVNSACQSFESAIAEIVERSILKGEIK